MKKLFFIILSFFVVSNVSAKCDWVAYFSATEHYYNNDWSFCKPWEHVTDFQAIKKDLSSDDDWNGDEFSYLADIYSYKDWLSRARVILNWKNLLELSYVSESVFTKSIYSLSWKHVFTTFAHEKGIPISDLDKDVLWFYIDWKQIMKTFSFSSEFIYKNLWIVMGRNRPNESFITENEIKKIDNFLEKYEKLDKGEKQKLKETLQKEVYKYLDKNTYIYDSAKFDYDWRKHTVGANYKRYFVLNYVLQEIIVSELLKKS